MNQPECQRLLQERLDGRLTPDCASLVQHLVECAPCREWHAASRSLEEGLRGLLLPVPPVDLSDRIVGRVLRERRRHLVRRRWLQAGALAAGLLAAMWLGWTWWPVSAEIPTPSVSVAVVESPNQEPASTPPLSVHQTMTEAGTMVASLARRATDETFSPQLFLPEAIDAAPPLVGADSWHQTWEPSARELREASQGVTSGLRPVTTSAQRAWNLFLRDLPSSTEEEGKTQF